MCAVCVKECETVPCTCLKYESPGAACLVATSAPKYFDPKKEACVPFQLRVCFTERDSLETPIKNSFNSLLDSKKKSGKFYNNQIFTFQCLFVKEFKIPGFVVSDVRNRNPLRTVLFQSCGVEFGYSFLFFVHVEASFHNLKTLNRCMYSCVKNYRDHCVKMHFVLER